MLNILTMETDDDFHAIQGVVLIESVLSTAESRAVLCRVYVELE